MVDCKTIPVRSKDIFDSKILASLTVALPEYVVAVVFALLALKPSFTGALWIITMPAAYIVFLAVTGIAVNLAMPVFNWENEIRAVKQRASVMVTLLIGFISSITPIVCLLAIGSVSPDRVMGVTLPVICLLTLILYNRNNRKSVLYIG